MTKCDARIRAELQVRAGAPDRECAVEQSVTVLVNIPRRLNYRTG
jgi:hypothetical protein